VLSSVMAYPLAMRGRDEDNAETTHGPSRSEARRAALDVLALGERLAALPPAQLAKLPVPEALLPHIAETRRMASHGARKRQLGFLAKQMRREDPEALDAIRDALDAGGEASRRETALLHRAEAARTKLLEGGDEALTAFLETIRAPTASDCGSCCATPRRNRRGASRRAPSVNSFAS